MYLTTRGRLEVGLKAVVTTYCISKGADYDNRVKLRLVVTLTTHLGLHLLLPSHHASHHLNPMGQGVKNG